MDPDNQGQELTREERARRDIICISNYMLVAPEEEQLALLVTASRIYWFVAGRELVNQNCCICQNMTREQIRILGVVSLYTYNLHCHRESHQTVFHAYCALTHICCNEPYDPDNQYVWRSVGEESQLFDQTSEEEQEEVRQHIELEFDVLGSDLSD